MFPNAPCGAIRQAYRDTAAAAREKRRQRASEATGGTSSHFKGAKVRLQSMLLRMHNKTKSPVCVSAGGAPLSGSSLSRQTPHPTGFWAISPFDYNIVREEKNVRDANRFHWQDRKLTPRPS
jgi:hypothetical protein